MKKGHTDKFKIITGRKVIPGMSISCLVASGALATLELVMSVRPGGIGGAWQGFLWAAGADPS